MKHHEFFYIAPQFIHDNLIEIKSQEFKHLAVVLKKRIHDIVEIVDGTGNLYTAVLKNITKNAAIAEIQKRSRYFGEPNFHLTLAQSIPKGSRFDWVVEKGTELGVSKFIPLITENSVVKSGETKINRWQKIAIAAMKQCTRSVLPEITLPQTLAELLLSKQIYDFSFIAHQEQSSKPFAQLIINRKSALNRISKIKNGIIIIGPEGGFTHDEIKKAKQQNYELFSLGQRRLRAETAGIVAAAILMELMENLS